MKGRGIRSVNPLIFTGYYGASDNGLTYQKAVARAVKSRLHGSDGCDNGLTYQMTLQEQSSLIRLVYILNELFLRVTWHPETEKVLCKSFLCERSRDTLSKPLKIHWILWGQ